MAEGITIAGRGNSNWMGTDSGHPLQGLTTLWMTKVRLALAHKKKEFQDDADEAMQFFDGPHDFMYRGDYTTRSAFRSEEGLPQPSFRMTLNKVAEMVQLFGPSLYYRNPYRQITPRKIARIPPGLLGDPQHPAVQQVMQQMTQQFEKIRIEDEMRAILLETYLNYTPHELNLKEHSRQCIDEAVIKGMGVLWTELYTPPGQAMRFVRSTYDSVDNLLIDPDMESIEDATWIARRRVMPVWAAEKKFTLKRGTLHGNMESYHNQASGGAGAEVDYYRKRGDTNDLITFWEIYSRLGMGHRLRDRVGSASGAVEYAMQKHLYGPEAEVLDKFGDYVYLACCDEHPFPLNLPPESQKGDINEAFFRVQWPIPFWLDPADPWPMTPVMFHRRPRKVWPMSHLKPGLGELKLLNWIFSFMADKIKNTSRDFIAVLKSAGEDIKSTVLSGRDLTLIEIEKQHGNITDVIQFLQHPQWNGDIWKVAEAVLKMFEDRVGLNELLYGESRKQMRSSAEAQIKGQSVKVRPDDMATKVEESMTALARKEALAARWHLNGSDVAPIMGDTHARLWTKYVQSGDPRMMVHELSYRIEAGSIRKPNRERDAENANQAVQTWGPLLQNYFQMTGDPEPINALMAIWLKANDMEAGKFLLKPPPPPEGPSPEEQKLQLEREKAQIDAQGKQQDAMLKQASETQKIQADAAKARIEIERGMLEAALDRERMEMELAQDAAKHQLEMATVSEKAALDRKVAEAKAKAAAKPKPNGSSK